MDITKSTDNILVTSRPEDMFNIIHAQMNVAHDKLPSEYLKEVAIACLQVLQDVQRESHDSLLHNYRNMEAEVLCAIINDNQRMDEKCREFTADMTKHIESEEDRNILEAISDEVAGEYLAISVRGVEALARCIMDVLEEPIFSKLFSPEWEQSNDNETLMSTLTVTLEDYFNDLSSWLTHYHFSRLVVKVLHLVVGHYIMSLRRKANGAFTFTNELIVANKVIKDRTVAYDYFVGLKDILEHGRLKPKKAAASNSTNIDQALNDALEPMYSMARVISCHNLESAEIDAKELFSRYGIDGLKVLQSCFLSNPCISRNDRSNYYETCKKLYDNFPNKDPELATTGSPDYEGYDANVTLANANKDNSSRVRTFWGGLKSLK